VRYSLGVRSLVFAALVLVACHGTPAPDAIADAQASPQANAVPAPLATEQEKQAPPAPTSLEAGPPPAPMRGDEALDRDTPASPTKEAPLLVYTMLATLRPVDPPGPPKAPEISQATIDAARRRLDPKLAIDLSPARLRVELSGPGWLLPSGWELRARSDRYGHVLVSSDGSTYRVLAPGALRAFFGERRLDVAPMAVAEVSSKGDGSKRLGMKTRRVEVSSRSAKAWFELARIEGTADAGPLLARMLLDLMSAPPSTVLAQPDEVPVHGEIRWSSRGGLVFDGTALAKRADVTPTQLVVPPANAAFTSDALPRQGAAILLSDTEVAQLHVSPVDVGPQPLPPGGDSRATLTLGNATDELRVAWIDGVPAAWVAPRARIDLAGLFRGRYQVEWRTYLNDAAEVPVAATAPGSSEVGAADAGAATPTK